MTFFDIKLVLHPRHKLMYFKRMDWDVEWISTAEGLVREEFERSYMAAKNINTDNSDLKDTEGTSQQVNHQGKKVRV